jgi:hypothetical protein
MRRPEISHALTIAVDPYGAITESATVAYPRQGTPHDEEQEKPWVSYTTTSVINNDADSFWRRIGVSYKTSLWELTGLEIPVGIPLTPVQCSMVFKCNYDRLRGESDSTQLQKRCVRSCGTSTLETIFQVRSISVQ